MKLETLAMSKLFYPGILALVVAVLFLTGAPTDDAFSWPDAPRHALNGAFVLDFVRDHPFTSPTAYAMNYYVKYPALTILFYPPLFYVFLAISYAIFGVSQGAALAAEFLFYAAFSVGCFRLARNWLSPLEAFGAALILTAAPEIAYWGRQVMLEVPAMAFLVWSAVFVIRSMREQRPVWLYLGIALAVLAMYVKVTSGFILVVYFLVLLRERGKNLFSDRHSYFVALAAIISLLPLVVLTLKFGQANVQSASGIADSEVSRASIGGWIWYARQLPGQIGWPCLAFALIGALYVLVDKSRASKFLPLSIWFLVGYVFFSAIDLKESRHSVSLLIPVAICAAMGVRAVLARWPLSAGPAIVALGVITLCLTYVTRPVQYVAGYKEVSDYIAKIAPKDGVIVFSGYRDGSFIFAMRTHEERRDLWTVRSDKLLLRIAVRRSLGVGQKLMSVDEITKMLDGLGVQYVVAQPDFWTDLEAMRRFDEALHTDHFQLVRKFRMAANYHAQETQLVVYRNLGHVATGGGRLNIDIPMINQTVSGTISGR